MADVTVKNESSRDLFVEGDPNWDDQQLLIDNNPTHSIYTLSEGASIVVSVVGGDDMGIVFAESKDYESSDGGFYQLEIGHVPGTDNLAVTGIFPYGQLNVLYTISDQQPSSMTMHFLDK
jgi:hypothetical protein